MGWRDEVLKQKPEPEPEKPAAAPAGKWRSIVTARTLATSETPTGRPTADQLIPEPVSGGGLGFMANLKANIPEDPETSQRVMAESAGMRSEDMGTINNRPVFKNARGEMEYADAGGASRFGKAMANAPEFVGGAVGSLASPIAGTAIGATGGKAAKQILSSIVFDEPQTTAGNVKGLATEAAVNAVPAGALKAGGALYNRAAVRNAEKFDLPAARALQDRIKGSTGIELDLAQAANIPQLRDLKKWAAKFPSDAREIIAALDTKQAGQVGDAITDRVLKALARDEDPSVLAGAGVNAASNAIKMAKLERSAAVKPLYDEAYKQEIGESTLNSFRGDPIISRSLNKVRNATEYKKDLQGVPDTSIKVLDLAKRDLDDQVDVALRAGERDKARRLSEARDRLVKATDAAAGESYKRARSEYQRLSKELVEPLENGSVGILAKIKGPAMVRQVAKVMDDVLANPNAVKGLRVALTNQQGPESWNKLVKLSLAKQFDKAAKETQGGDVVNLAGKFRQAVVGTPSRAKAMDEALDPSVRPVFDDLMESLQLIAREARSRGGSDTAFNQEITKLQKGGAFTSLGRFVTAPAKTIREALDGKVLEKNSVALAEALTDPAKLKVLKELRKMRPSTERALAILGVAGIGQSVIEPTVDSALKKRPNAIPQSPQQPQPQFRQ